LGYGREAYFWALIAAVGVFVLAVAFSLRDGIQELVHPSTTSSDPTLRAAFVEDAVSIPGDVLAFAALGLNQAIGSSIPQGVAAALIAVVMVRISLRLVQRDHDFLVGTWAHAAGGQRAAAPRWIYHETGACDLDTSQCGK
jgi:hypothetical protein